MGRLALGAGEVTCYRALCRICLDYCESALMRADSVAIEAVHDRRADLIAERVADLETLARTWLDLSATHTVAVHEHYIATRGNQREILKP